MPPQTQTSRSIQYRGWCLQVVFAGKAGTSRWVKCPHPRGGVSLNFPVLEGGVEGAIEAAKSAIDTAIDLENE